MSLSTANPTRPSTTAASTPTLFSSPALSNANGSESQSPGLAFSLTPSSTVASSSAATSSTSNAQGPPGISKSSSLLFGFLVTFLALFVTFMACGFGGRRAMHIRRRRIAGMYDDDLPMSPSRMVKPQLWDVWIEDGGKERWPSMLPLSASIKRAAEERPVSLPQPRTAPVEPQVPQEYFPAFVAVGGRGIARITATPTYSPAIRRGTSLSLSPHTPPSSLTPTNAWSTSPFPVPGDPPSWLSFLSRRNKGQTRDADKRADEDIDGLRVSVLIAMPTPRRSKAAEADVHEEHVGGELGEFALGIATVPWSSPPEDVY